MTSESVSPHRSRLSSDLRSCHRCRLFVVLSLPMLWMMSIERRFVFAHQAEDSPVACVVSTGTDIDQAATSSCVALHTS